MEYNAKVDQTEMRIAGAVAVVFALSSIYSTYRWAMATQDMSKLYYASLPLSIILLIWFILVQQRKKQA